MREIEGYGIRTDTAEWIDNLHDVINNTLGQKSEVYKNKYEEYCDYNDLNPNGDFHEEFIDGYENETMCTTGVEALLTDIINELEYNNDQIFFFDDCAIYTPSTIPRNEKAKELMPTQEDVQNILSRYIGPLTKKPITIEWLTIHC